MKSLTTIEGKVVMTMMINLKNLMKNSFIKITPEKAMALMEREKNLLIIDVRTRQEFESKSLPESINIPLDHIESIQERITNKERKIILYSNGVTRSAKAYERLKEFGYTDVVILNGLNEWPF